MISQSRYLCVTLGVMAGGRGARFSLYLSVPLAARREWVRQYTGYRDSDIYERGLLVIEAELSAAFQWDPAWFCPHPARYRNGACTRCYAAPPGAHLVPDVEVASDAAAG